jgi:hypothetical protein
MHKILEYATRAPHAAADAWNASPQKYDYLARPYAFEGSVEARWEQTPGLERVLDVQTGRLQLTHWMHGGSLTASTPARNAAAAWASSRTVRNDSSSQPRDCSTDL